MKYFYIILSVLLFLFIGIRIIFFLISPIIKRTSLVKVYNPFFFVRKKRRYIEIHLGFARDLLISDSFSRRKVFVYLASGLLKLINEIEAGKIELNIIIQGNPYFFKLNNFQNFGFYARDLSFTEKIRFYLNYFELSFLKSFASKKIVLVKVNKLKIVYTDARTLLKSKNKILSFYQRIKRENETISSYNDNQLLSTKAV